MALQVGKSKTLSCRVWPPLAPQIHPGEILLKEFLRPMGITQGRFDLAKAKATLGRRLSWEVRVHSPA